MSGTFKGFTEKDIEKIKNVKRDPPVFKKIQNKSKPNPQVVTLKKMPEEKFEIVDLKAKPTQEKEADVETQAPVKSDVQNSSNESNNNLMDEDGDKEDKIIDEILAYKTYDALGLEKPINLEEFQIHQKLIEEQNRKRKEMLAKALEDRSKQTAEEAVRLENIKKELQSLDAQLSDDVSILRKKIEKASLVYNDAEKNYHRIEKEFLAAKMLLQKEKERKELLTEHLCTLIAHNEARKAKKLESLMDQLAYNKVETPSLPPRVVDGVCEQTGKILEMINGEVVPSDD